MARGINRLPPRRTHVQMLRGGLDTDTPPWQVDSGRIASGRNFEIDVAGGYRDIEGYERFDGRPSPSEASYLTVLPLGATESPDDPLVILTTPIRVRFGNAGSLKYAWRIATKGALQIFAELNNENWQTLKPIPTLTNGETLYESANNAGITWTATSHVVGRWGLNDLVLPSEGLRAKAASADRRRIRIRQVPGTGPVRGVWMYGNDVFAARDHTDGTHLRVYKATSNGWSNLFVGVKPIKVIRFTTGRRTSGTAATPQGAITHVTQGGHDYTGKLNSNDPAPFMRQQSGSWVTGDATGVIIFHRKTSVQDGAASVTATNFVGSMTIEGSTFTLKPGGRIETDTGDFGYGDRVYGVDGVNPCFEFDGESMLQISSGRSHDAPNHVKTHVNHLFLAFGRWLQHSGVGNPYDFSALAGAAELVMPNDITAMNIEPGEHGNAALSVFTRHRISILYGTAPTGTEGWELIEYRREVGAYAGTVQEILQTAFLDDAGVRYLETVQAFGSFHHATLTEHLQTYINELLAKSAPVGSCVIRSKNQYRVFFGDGDAIYMTFREGRLVGAMPILLEKVVNVIHSGESEGGAERVFFGAGGNDGYVYEMEKGPSFDGADIVAFFRTHPNYTGRRDIGYLKRFVRAVVQASGAGYGEYRVAFAAQIDTNPAAGASSFSRVAREDLARWDDGIWDVGTWDGSTIGPTQIKLSGEGEKISYTVLKRSAWQSTVQFTGLMLEYIPRRMVR